MKFTQIIILFTLISCQTTAPSFQENNAYQLLLKQCDFGPRNPGSEGYESCKNMIIETMKSYADTVIYQGFTFKEQKNNISYNSQNIIGRFNPESDFQTIISAHWDTRPWADKDKDKKNHNKPILGANDGASGVAILLELARILSKNKPPIGVSLVFFDAEDLGVDGKNGTYCRGSDYFARNLPIPKPDEAINLDMVGDKQLTIPIERYSYRFHPKLVRKLWSRAREMDLNAFVNKLDYAIYDDHVPLYEIAGIPAIDIIDFRYPNKDTNYWHTMDDIPENCSARSLGQVGELMVEYIYNISLDNLE